MSDSLRGLEIKIDFAANPATPVNTLRVLAGCSEGNVQFLSVLAANPSVPVDVLGVLAGHEDSLVRVAVARNVSTPVELLEVLRFDVNVDVRVAALDSLG